MKKNNCCIIFITYKEVLENNDKKSFEQCLKVFKEKRDIKLLIPNNITTEFYDKFNVEYVKVNPEWLSSIKAYNYMCCNKEFYELFNHYDYILIYQTDCWVFEDRLDYFMELGYDYYGAPWPIYNDQVGNGGFSLRKVSKMIELTNKYTYNGKLNEDGWFCLTHKNDLNICDLDNACNFSMEIISLKYFPKIKTYPMGLHSSRVYQFWDEDGYKFLEYKKKIYDIKISIITVNLNNKDGLKKTIESVINQTFFDNVEYIIIDGGSTDGSAELIEQYKDKLLYYVSEKDNGIYDAMNKGVEKANGEYCIFLNSGDRLYSNNVISEVLPQLNNDIVYGDLLINEKNVKKYVDILPKNYFNYESLPHPASFIKTELLKKNKYNTDYKIISDWIFFKEMIFEHNKTYKHINTVVSNFNLGGVSSNLKEIENEKSRYSNSISYNGLISIVIPCYNQAKYVRDTIISVKAQRYKDFCCVIVNDGSTDNSEEVILNEIKGDDRFKYFKIENQGLGHARNFGIDKTNSKYILCLDSDDLISPYYVKEGVEFLEKYKDFSIFYARAKFLYDDGTEKEWQLRPYSYKSLLLCNMIYCSHIFRRDEYNRTNGYDEKIYGFQDWDFLVQLLNNNSNVYMSNNIGFYYRRHEDSMDYQVKNKRTKYLLYIYNKNKEKYHKNNIRIEIKKSD